MMPETSAVNPVPPGGLRKLGRIQKNAIKAGVRASKRHHHLITSDELMGLKIQLMPTPVRAFLFFSGCLLLVFAFTAWPTASLVYQVVEGLAGLVLLFSGLFGIRRTFSGILDGLGNVGAEALLEAVIGGIGSVFD